MWRERNCTSSESPALLAERRTRADLLFKAKHYSDAAHDYRDLVE